MFFIHSEHEKRQHSKNHHKSGSGCADTVLEKKEQGQSYRKGSRKTDKLALGEIKHYFGLYGA